MATQETARRCATKLPASLFARPYADVRGWWGQLPARNWAYLHLVTK